MSDPRQELAAVRLELWSLLGELRSGELDPEVAGLAVGILDSLIETVRVEQRHKLRAGGTYNRRRNMITRTRKRGMPISNVAKIPIIQSMTFPELGPVLCGGCTAPVRGGSGPDWPAVPIEDCGIG